MNGNAVLHQPVLDSDLGFVLAPMSSGIRLTTGVEFARRDAPPTPVQVQQALPRARALFPLGEAIDAKPWMGARPCLPDMLPENDDLRKRHAPLKDFVAATCKTPLLFSPGTKVKYQSMGILLAGEIVQRVADRTSRRPAWC